MAKLIIGEDAQELWSNAMVEITKAGKKEKSRIGEVVELLHVVLELTNPQQKWVLNRFPPMNISFALAELMWILGGRNDRRLIDFWNKKYSNFVADENSDQYYGAYGNRLIFKHGFNQIDRAYEVLKNNKENRQVVLQIWDAKSDLPNKDGTPQSRDIPCNVCSMIKIRDNRLLWTQIMRSNDIFLGLPYNIIQFTGLQEIMAGWLGINAGTYTHFSDSLHVYTKDLIDTKVCAKSPTSIYNNDSLSIPKKEFDFILIDILNRMEKLVDADCEKEIFNLGKLDCKYSAYNNIMAMIALSIARKKKYRDAKEKLLNICTNPCYIAMWNQWENFYNK